MSSSQPKQVMSCTQCHREFSYSTRNFACPYCGAIYKRALFAKIPTRPKKTTETGTHAESESILFYAYGIAWAIALVSTLAHVQNPGTFSPESWGGGLGGFAAYLFFSGVIWSVIIRVLLGILLAIAEVFKRK